LDETKQLRKIESKVFQKKRRLGAMNYRVNVTLSEVTKSIKIFHNYIRPHQALKGKTPAEIAGIKVEGENKWITIIQNASRKDAKC
jgi:hypothetical protein